MFYIILLIVTHMIAFLMGFFIFSLIKIGSKIDFIVKEEENGN